jgi:hypothetical protein
MSWRFTLALLLYLAMAGCVGFGYQPPPGANIEPVHGDSGGGGAGGGAGM